MTLHRTAHVAQRLRHPIHLMGGVESWLSEETELYARVNLRPLRLRCTDPNLCVVSEDVTYIVRNQKHGARGEFEMGAKILFPAKYAYAVHTNSFSTNGCLRCAWQMVVRSAQVIISEWGPPSLRSAAEFQANRGGAFDDGKWLGITEAVDWLYRVHGIYPIEFNFDEDDSTPPTPANKRKRKSRTRRSRANKKAKIGLTPPSQTSNPPPSRNTKNSRGYWCRHGLRGITAEAVPHLPAETELQR
jgi:hypothetical protein